MKPMQGSLQPGLPLQLKTCGKSSVRLHERKSMLIISGRLLRPFLRHKPVYRGFRDAQSVVECDLGLADHPAQALLLRSDEGFEGLRSAADRCCAGAQDALAHIGCMNGLDRLGV